MHRATPLLAILLCAGCDGGLITLGTTELMITTDKTEYAAAYIGGEGTYREYQFTTVVRVENTGTGTSFLSLCSPNDRTPTYGVELLGDVHAESGYNPVWACTGHDKAIRLDPGDARTFTLRIHGPNAWNGRTGEVMGALEGAMRLHLGIDCPQRPYCAVSTASNSFTVVLGAS